MGVRLTPRLAALAGLTTSANCLPRRRQQGREEETSLREKEIHRAIEAMLRRHGIRHYCHARMDRRSTVATGWPDFTVPVPGGKVLFWEVKTPAGALTDAQAECLAALKLAGHEAVVIRSVRQAEEHLLARIGGRHLPEPA